MEIKIETDYNYDDEVWCIKNNEIAKYRISGIEIKYNYHLMFTKESREKRILSGVLDQTYSLVDKRGYNVGNIEPKDMFKSKEELIKYISYNAKE